MSNHIKNQNNKYNLIQRTAKFGEEIIKFYKSLSLRLDLLFRF